MNNPQVICISTTHLKKVRELEKKDPQKCANHKVTVKFDSGKVLPTYRLTKGKGDQNIAPYVLKETGFNRKFIQKMLDIRGFDAVLTAADDVLPIEDDKKVLPGIDDAATRSDTSVAKEQKRDYVSHKDSVETPQSYPVGLRNPDRRCYMNAALQCFYNSESLQQAIEGKKEAFTSQSLGQLYGNYQTTRNTQADEEFCKKAREILQFVPNTDQDSSEFIEMFIDVTGIQGACQLSL